MQRRRSSLGDDRQDRGGSVATESLQRLKRLDIYARPKREFQRTTTHGAVVSIILVVLIYLLVWRELRFSMQTETVERLFVNATIAPQVTVTFDVAFPRIACGFISIDTEDQSGIPQAGTLSDVTRMRLDAVGRPIGPEEEHELGNTLKEAIAKEAELKAAGKGEAMDECNCYGAGEEGGCCRTCEDIKAAYRKRGWKLNTADVPICASEKTAPRERSDVRKGSIKEGEGCRLAGTLHMTKTQGNFHFAPGYRLHRRTSSMNVVDRTQVALESFNTTHTIHSLSFGNQSYPAHDPVRYTTSASMLEGHVKTVQITHAMHQYFLQLVPTTYRFLDGTTVYRSQYSVTEHLRQVTASSNSGLPGVYFYYEISPIQALVEERRPGLLSFATNTCGVVGGVYSLLSLVNSGIDGRAKRSRGRLE